MKLSRNRIKEIVKETLVEENEYQKFFQSVLQKHGGSISKMGTQEKKDFFNKIDAAWNARGEKRGSEKPKPLSGNQKKLDVDNDGDIGADDLAALRAGKKKTEVFEAVKPNKEAIKFLKGMKKIKVNGLGGWMPGNTYIWYDDKSKKYWFVDTDGDYLEIRNDGVLKQIQKVVRNESINEYKAEDGGDDILMIKIGGEKGKYWPWYIKKIDSTHFKMANNEKALNNGAAMVSHVGQHRGDTYYSTLVDWLHGKIKTNQINGKKFEGNG